MEQALQAVPGRKEGHYPSFSKVNKKKKHGLEISWQYYRKKMT